MPEDLKQWAFAPKTNDELEQWLKTHKWYSDHNLLDEIDFVGTDKENRIVTIHFKPPVQSKEGK